MYNDAKLSTRAADLGPSCNFCGKDRSDGRRMISLPKVSICEHCVRHAAHVLTVEGGEQSADIIPAVEE